MIIFATMTTFLAGLILHEPLPTLAHNCVSEVGERNTQTPPQVENLVQCCGSGLFQKFCSGSSKKLKI